MKITPAAIRQKTFEVGFRGYEKRDVTLFLDEISEIVDTLHKENMELRSKLQHTEDEAKRLKDVEESLFRTLKTAEDTGAAIIEEATEAADLIISEANSTASNATRHVDKLLSESKQIAEEQAAAIIGAAETKAKETIVELRDSIEGLIRSYEALVEQREAVVKSLRRIAQDSLNQIDLSDAHFSRIDGKAYQRAIDELSRSQTFTFANLHNLDASFSQEPEIAEDSLTEMEVIGEQIEIEAHDAAPDVVLEEEEYPAEDEDIVQQHEDDPIDEEEEEEVKPAPTVASRPVQPAPAPPTEDPSKQSGSFFDQFD